MIIVCNAAPRALLGGGDGAFSKRSQHLDGQLLQAPVALGRFTTTLRTHLGCSSLTAGVWSQLTTYPGRDNHGGGIGLGPPSGIEVQFFDRPDLMRDLTARKTTPPARSQGPATMIGSIV